MEEAAEAEELAEAEEAAAAELAAEGEEAEVLAEDEEAEEGEGAEEYEESEEGEEDEASTSQGNGSSSRGAVEQQQAESVLEGGVVPILVAVNMRQSRLPQPLYRTVAARWRPLLQKELTWEQVEAKVSEGLSQEDELVSAAEFFECAGEVVTETLERKYGGKRRSASLTEW